MHAKICYHTIILLVMCGFQNRTPMPLQTHLQYLSPFKRVFFFINILFHMKLVSYLYVVLIYQLFMVINCLRMHLWPPQVTTNHLLDLYACFLQYWNVIGFMELLMHIIRVLSLTSHCSSAENHESDDFEFRTLHCQTFVKKV